MSDSWRSKPGAGARQANGGQQHTSTHLGGEINKPQVKPIRAGRTVTEQTDVWMWAIPSWQPSFQQVATNVFPDSLVRGGLQLYWRSPD